MKPSHSRISGTRSGKRILIKIDGRAYYTNHHRWNEIIHVINRRHRGSSLRGAGKMATPRTCNAFNTWYRRPDVNTPR